jgi:hypothetical protein
VLGERPQRRDLGARQPGRRAQLVRVVGQQLLRRGRPAAEALGQPPVDGPGGLDGQLLAGDRAQQRAVEVGGPAGRVRPIGQRSAVLDEALEDRVLREMCVSRLR